MTEFTKGPWVKCKRGESLIGVNGIVVGIHNCGLTGVNKSKEAVANSNLISMAPEMYELLKVFSNMTMPTAGELYEKCDEAKLLLKKARGE